MASSTAGTCTCPVVCRRRRRAWARSWFVGAMARHLEAALDRREDLLRAARSSVRVKRRRASPTAEGDSRGMAWCRCRCCRSVRDSLRAGCTLVMLILCATVLPEWVFCFFVRDDTRSALAWHKIGANEK